MNKLYSKSFSYVKNLLWLLETSKSPWRCGANSSFYFSFLICSNMEQTYSSNTHTHTQNVTWENVIQFIIPPKKIMKWCSSILKHLLNNSIFWQQTWRGVPVKSTRCLLEYCFIEENNFESLFLRRWPSSTIYIEILALSPKNIHIED